MDLSKAIQDLYTEKRAIERAIALLEDFQRSAGQPAPELALKRRGRKSMGAAERGEVSARMKKYWANRRKAIKQLS